MTPKQALLARNEKRADAERRREDRNCRELTDRELAAYLVNSIPHTRSVELVPGTIWTNAVMREAARRLRRDADDYR